MAQPPRLRGRDQGVIIAVMDENSGPRHIAVVLDWGASMVPSPRKSAGAPGAPSPFGGTPMPAGAPAAPPANVTNASPPAAAPNGFGPNNDRLKVGARVVLHGLNNGLTQYNGSGGMVTSAFACLEAAEVHLDPPHDKTLLFKIENLEDGGAAGAAPPAGAAPTAAAAAAAARSTTRSTTRSRISRPRRRTLRPFGTNRSPRLTRSPRCVTCRRRRRRLRPLLRRRRRHAAPPTTRGTAWMSRNSKPQPSTRRSARRKPQSTTAHAQTRSSSAIS